MDQNTSLWVFGYGSICWHPGFHTRKSVYGHINNYVRRFWQGNTTHRGVPEKPGRVATLVKEDTGSTWGVAYEITGNKAFEYLNNREVTLGGYYTEIVQFFPKDGSSSFPVLLYITNSTSKEWAGPAPLHEIASQIITSAGATGHNVEYLLRLADFMKEKLPEGYDDHLSTLETIVRLRIKENKLCLRKMMGETTCVIESHMPDAVAADLENNVRRDTFQYSTKLPQTKLRCLNV